MRFKTVYQYHKQVVIKLISLVISNPRAIILFPSICVFILSYNVVYDFTIKKINSHLPISIDHQTLFNHLDLLPPRDCSDKIKHLGASKLASDSKYGHLTKISLSIESTAGSEGRNILNFEFFNQLYNLQQSLSETYQDDVIIISPVSDWPMNKVKFDDPSLSTSIFNVYLIKYLNYDLNNLLTFLYVDQIVKSNHLIKYAKNIKVYFIHNELVDVTGFINSFINSTSNIFKIDESSSTQRSSSIRDFINYFLLQKRQNFYSNLFISSSNIVIFTSIISYIIYIYVSISNEHKIRSSFGLVFGWIVGILISCGAAVNLTVLVHGYKSWRLIFEPLTAFTKAAYVFAVILMSSRSLFITIETLANSESNLIDFHRRLHKLYVGYNGFPLVLKSVLFNILGAFGAYGYASFLLCLSTEGNSYFKHRCLKMLELVLYSIIIQTFLQLTYMVGIIMVDLKRVDYTRILNDQIAGFPESDVPLNANEGVNFISSLLLRLDQPSHLRPSRNFNSKRFLLGQFFLKMGYSINSNLLTFAINIALLLAVSLHWILIIPFNLMNENQKIVDLGGLNILSNTNNFIYYLELLSILIFIITTSFIVFRLTKSISSNQMIGSKSPLKLDESDFEADKKFFNTIELPAILHDTRKFKEEITGHSLDIIKVKTNSKSSFIVSIGLDHKVLIWSPLIQPVPAPINIATTISLNGDIKEFWPINHVNISDGGKYIILMNYKYGLVKCFERKELNYKWESFLPHELTQKARDKKFKILESFFRRRTVPGFLARKIIQKQKESKPAEIGSVSSTQSISPSTRRNSNVSLASMNGNFPPPLDMRYVNNQKDLEIESQLSKDDFISIFDNGDLLLFSCKDGKLKVLNIINSVYPQSSTKLYLISVKKVSTPRINDRIVCQVNNYDIIIGTVINNGWKFKKLPVKEGFYNQQGPTIIPEIMTKTNSFIDDNDFKSIYMKSAPPKEVESNTIAKTSISTIQVNKPLIIPVEFVGMIVRVKNFTAELIDIQRGYVLKTFNVGHFKPSTFKVSHLEPTHCKFCGCASIQSFSIIYEDFDQPTLIIHTFRIDIKRSKNNICLRVERDPREIRCLGFNAVTEHQYWFNNVEGWELTDVNMIIGLRKKGILNDDNYHLQEVEFETISSSSRSKSNDFDSFVDNSGLASLRRRNKATKPSRFKISTSKAHMDNLWDAFIITVFDGKEINYQIPETDKHNSIDFLSNRINCVEKYGYKSAIVCASNLMEIFYLGNDKLIEDDIYFSGTNATIWSVLEDDSKKSNGVEENDAFKQVQPFNSELLFINKRRKMSERQKGNRIQPLKEATQ